MVTGSFLLEQKPVRNKNLTAKTFIISSNIIVVQWV